MEAQEIWKPVADYEGLYMVSNLGRVKSVPRPGTKGGILKPAPDDRGYLKVKLYKNGGKSTHQVHRLVMRAFVGECPDGYEVDHVDWNPKNNRLSNLRYLPAEENNSRKSPEWYKNTAEANKKRSQDPEWLRKNAEHREKMYQDPEWQRKNAEANRRKAQDPEWRKKNAEVARKKYKPVNQYTLDGDYVKTWSSATEAAKELGLKQPNISSCCKGKYKQAYGFIWRYAVCST